MKIKLKIAKIKMIPMIVTILASALVAIWAFNEMGLLVGILVAFIPWWILSLTKYFKEK